MDWLLAHQLLVPLGADRVVLPAEVVAVLRRTAVTDPARTLIDLTTPAPHRPAPDSARVDPGAVGAVLDALHSRYLPGLSDHLIVEHAIGPEHFRDVLNTPRGSAFSLQPTLFQSGWFRPHNRSRAVKGLYLVGAGTHPGAGVPAVLASGKIAADLIAADQGAQAPRTTGGRAR